MEMVKNRNIFFITILTLVTQFSAMEVDLSKCYDRDVFCFGSLNNMKSVGSNYGCIKYNDCNLLLYAEVSNDPSSHVEFVLISKWNGTMNSSFSRFSISKNQLPFSHESGFIDARFNRQPGRVTEWSSTVNLKTPFISEKNAQNIIDETVSVYYYAGKETGYEDSIITFKTKGEHLFYYDYQNLAIDLLHDNLYVHMQLVVDRKLIESPSFDFPYKLFGPKDINKPPISTTTSMYFETTTPITRLTTLITSMKVSNTTKFPKNLITTDTAGTKSDQTNLFIVIALVVGVIAIISVIIVCIFCLKSNKKSRTKSKRKHSSPLKSKKRSTYDVTSSLPEMYGDRKTLPQSAKTSKNYKKSLEDSRYDEPVEKRKSFEKVENPKENTTGGGTTVFNPDDGYSTYFKN